uniref:Major facilitator superfamily (MFS) profile domain-containing protein n=1 Tax=Photinus pyralis TaxID=7054 RepID=A0A1Y1K5E0_PHOPY
MVNVHLGSDPSNERIKCNLGGGLSRIREEITVEPVLVLFMLSSSISALAIENLNLEKSCYVNLNLSTSICDAMQQRNRSGFSEMDEITVQKVVAAAGIWKSAAYCVLITVLLPLFGSWSDRNKTVKILILLPILGEIVANIGLILCTYFYYEWPMEVNSIFEILPTAITGGIPLALAGVFTYMSSNTTNENRTFRLGITHTLVVICKTIGGTLSGVLYQLVGLYGVFSVTLALYVLGAVYTQFMLPSCTKDQKRSLNKCELIVDVVNVKKTVGSFSFIATEGSGIQRRQLYAILFLEFIIVGPFVGQASVMYLYTRLRFNWDAMDYSVFGAYSAVCHLIGNVGSIVIFSKLLKADDSILGGVSTMSRILGGIGYALSPTVIWFYACTLLDVVNGTAFIVSRSMATKLVTESNMGKVNSLFGVIEALSALACTPAYSAFYRVTIEIFPGAFNILGVIVTLPAILIYIWLYIRRDVRA